MQITYKTIIEEINQIPVEFLEEVYNIIHSFGKKDTNLKRNRDKILNFAGSWTDMTDEDFYDMMTEIKNSKEDMFSRNIEL